jgi:alpha-L-fucosidase
MESITVLDRREFLKTTGLLAAGHAFAAGLRADETRNSMAVPTPAQIAWHDMELGMFFHFDIPIYKQGWDWRSFRDFPYPDLYQPLKLDTDQWMEAAKAMGAKYAVLVAKHCSGFLQWQSDLYPYGVKKSSWRNGKGDLVREFIGSCRKHGIRPGLYASVSANGYLGVDNPGLVNHGKGGSREQQAGYARICERMATELWTRYGDLFEIWFDGGAIPAGKGGPDLVPLLRKHQPDAVVFQGPPGTPNLIRWVGNERGVAPYPCWSTANAGTGEEGTAENAYAGSPDGRLWVPGECDVPVRDQEWFWRPGDEHRLNSVEQLVDMYCNSVGRNCNLLLNANPNPEGLIPEADFRRYEEFGREIRRRFERPVASTQGKGKLIELHFARPEAVNHVVIMEDIARGERVRAYEVEGLLPDGMRVRLCDGISIGHKRIQGFERKELSAIQLRITASVADPQIRNLAVFDVK